MSLYLPRHKQHFTWDLGMLGSPYSSALYHCNEHLLWSKVHLDGVSRLLYLKYWLVRPIACQWREAHSNLTLVLSLAQDGKGLPESYSLSG